LIPRTERKPKAGSSSWIDRSISSKASTSTA
jgi:hypothetical protein